LKDSDDVYARLIRLLLKQGKTREALERLEESHGKDMLDLLGDTLNAPSRHWSQEIWDKVRRFRKELYELDVRDQGSNSPGDKRSATTRELREQVRADRQRARAGLEKALQEARASSAASSGSETGKINQSLLEGKGHACAGLITHPSVMTVIFQTRRDPCWAFVLGGGKSEAVPLTISSHKIRLAAAKFRRAVVENEDDWVDKSHALSQIIWQPLAAFVKDKPQVLIIPDGGLWYVPFAALSDLDGKPLITSRRLGICSTVNLAARLLERENQTSKPKKALPGKILILADPDGSLPHARTEGAEIASLAGASGWQAETKVGSEASEIWLKRSVAGVERGSLHFATHGILDSASPLFSYLLSTPGDGEDGQLQVLEIANELNLRPFSPAVLSACNTAMGTVSGGNEMICLQQAFHDAGVPEILASLWEVSDEATARLMKAFYTRHFGGTPVGEALAEAIRPMTTEPPSRWAAFQLYGVP
ncbi:MAG TPA: CHAT domain-containing protein, partial [Candidatus Ozemobacteraceae bacterium]|nr:CHAT domain-containing protein [Candidatus Ozemobacteraceae bacterium]